MCQLEHQANYFLSIFSINFLSWASFRPVQTVIISCVQWRASLYVSSEYYFRVHYAQGAPNTSLGFVWNGGRPRRLGKYSKIRDNTVK
jgi:hypothetical protein